MKDFSRYLVRHYRYWSVYIHENQIYLGRCVIWCKRESVLDLTDITDDEREELFLVLRKLREALRAAFDSDWFNYAFLGNQTRHLHGHVVPRYAADRTFAGILFRDDKWGQNYHTDQIADLLPETIDKIKDHIKHHLTPADGREEYDKVVEAA